MDGDDNYMFWGVRVNDLFMANNKRLHGMCYIGNQIQVKCELSSPAYHIYRGYYDLRYMDSKGELFLCHRLPVKAHTNRDTKCEIGYYELKKLEFTKLAETNAWCWQQGSRLRWYPQNAKWVMFNDVSGDSYCTRIVDIETKKEVKKIDYPIYDISSDCKWGISLNYSRLQRLRPGYGYNYFEDKTLNQNAPSDDGLYAEEKVIFGGRLGEYKYYDMDQVIAAVLDKCENEFCEMKQ